MSEDRETVKIIANLEMSSFGVSREEEIDTDVFRAEWDAFSQDQRDGLAGKLVAEWVENLVQYGWSEVDES